jgi:hypothetical protein
LTAYSPVFPQISRRVAAAIEDQLHGTSLPPQHQDSPRRVDSLFKPPFFSGLSHIAGPVRCQSFLCLRKIPLLLRSAWAAQRSEAREVFQIAPLTRIQSERVRRLALASGFRLVRSFE